MTTDGYRHLVSSDSQAPLTTQTTTEAPPPLKYDSEREAEGDMSKFKFPSEGGNDTNHHHHHNTDTTPPPSPPPPPQQEEEQDSSRSPSPTKSLRFHLTFLSLTLTAFLSALEGAVVSTALPTISRSLSSGEDYIWVVNVYFLTSAAVQPLYSQIADLVGRKIPILSSILIFALGSGICGGSRNTGMLIAGRTVQGLGGAGINVLVEIIICDLVPLRERGMWMGFMFLFIVLGATAGPFLGGILVDRAGWRWCFWLNLPVCAVAFGLLAVFLRVKTPSTGMMDGDGDDKGMLAKVKGLVSKVDFAGLFLLCGATSSLLYALTYGGTRYVWSDARVIVSLVVGILGIGGYFAFQASPWCKHPAMPGVMFANRTTVAAMLATFMQLMVSYVPLYFLPIYFQAVQRVSASRSGVQIIPYSATFCVGGAIGGIIVSQLGRFKAVHIFSFGLMIISLGTFTILDVDTTMAVWVILQLIFGWAVGMPTASLLTAIQAELPDSLTAATTGAFAFMRSIATIFTVSVPAAVFGNRFDQLLASSDIITDPAIKAELSNGQAYEKASHAFINSFPQEIQDGIINMYEQSLQRVWYVTMAFAVAGFLIVMFEKNLKTRVENNASDFQLEEQKKDSNAVGL